ncbi:unnamed protein product [Parascedosporium putredinis]|uniref:Tyrosinase copper-binding domain-containing protein n=1 Tax=Parascedosporium putredinis TaxID=1442378 RepID=A0A9P1HA81_9PEZI|nr:unnamed protein product [Parascedosporium putredinis]CAI8002552.1 unnamed protein product [Parascedosporium putredinis]
MWSYMVVATTALIGTALGTAIPRAESTCTEPVVRKEWRELTTSEKAEYIRAAVCLRKLPQPSTPRLTRHPLRGQLLPWHRWYLQLHENLLRTECGFTGTQPYWDWSLDADALNTYHSPVFDPVTGFGGDGRRTGSNVPGFERCVVDGPFANTNLTLAMGWPDMNFSDMANMLEGLPHAQIHSIIFGDMGPATSPNEPLFFLHHANVDRAWAKWQGRNSTRLADYTGFQDSLKTITASIDDTMPVMALADNEPMVKDYMDIQAGPLCYTYSSL